MDNIIETEYETCFYCGSRFIRRKGSSQIACQYCIDNYLKSLQRLEVSYA
jgi:hypothetical protein